MNSILKGFLIAILTIISAISFAQNFDSGFVVGIAATQVDGDGNSGYDKGGPILGVWVGHRINHVLYTRMELRYIQKGSYAKSVENGATTGFYRMRLNYFEIPLILGYRFNNGFNALAGLSGGYLAKAIEMNQYGSFPAEEILKFHKFEIAWKFGIEYNQSEHWAFNAMFCYSMFPVRPHKGNITYRWDHGQYNNVIELVARYKLGENGPHSTYFLNKIFIFGRLKPYPMKELVRCRPCGYVMEADKLGDVCPACGLPRKVFEPYRERVSLNRLRILDLDLHPIAIHLSQSLVIAIPILTIILNLFPHFQPEIIKSVLIFSVFVFPFTLLLAISTGVIDGLTRFKTLKTPILRVKIIFSIIILVLSTSLFFIAPHEDYGLITGILGLLCLAAGVQLGLWGKHLIDVILPGTYPQKKSSKESPPKEEVLPTNS